MDKLVQIINMDYQQILQSRKNPDYHIFFDSFEWWIKTIKEWTNPLEDIHLINEIDPDQTIYNYDNTIDISDITDKTDRNECQYKPLETISSAKLGELYDIITDHDMKDFDKIRTRLETMFDYNLPSTISDMDKHSSKYFSSKMSNKNDINVVIIGAGPIGLYTALYLDEYYNNTDLINTRANIIVLDNRIYEEGIKLPYSRLTQFGFDIDQIQMFIKNINCWVIDDVYIRGRHFDFINTLENLLYIVAYHRKIPMYFTKKYETYEKIKKFAEQNNIQYILDCSGGRINALTHLSNDIKWDMYKLQKGIYEVKYSENNVYEFYVNGSKYKHITVVIQILDNNKRQLSYGNIFGFITDNDDEIIINKYKNMCLLKDDYLKIMKHIKSQNIRYLYMKLLKSNNIDENLIKYIKITSFNTNSHHTSKAAEKIGGNLTYIGLGNTLGTSEYGIFFGLRSGILFSKHICHLLSSVKYI
jgi:hypothetical protein